VPINSETGESESADEGEFEAVNMHLHPVAVSSGPSLKYTVHGGDTLDKLAARYHVSVATLKSWNGQLKKVRTGQTLTIAKPDAHERKSAAHPSAKKPAAKAPAHTHRARTHTHHADKHTAARHKHK
jgi:LysM repeat protein